MRLIPNPNYRPRVRQDDPERPLPVASEAFHEGAEMWRKDEHPVLTQRQVRNRYLKRTYHETVVVRGRDGYAPPAPLPPRVQDPMPGRCDMEARVQCGRRALAARSLHRLRITASRPVTSHKD